MRILGIDPALKITGYGIIDSNKQGFSLVKAGVVITNYRDALPVRLEKIYDAILGLINAYKPQVVSLEKIYVHYHHPTTAYLLGQSRGMICLACAKADVTLAEYAATQVKKAIVGRGLASKQQVQRVVMSLLGVKDPPRYTDVTDALALAIAYSYFSRYDAIKSKIKTGVFKL